MTSPAMILQGYALSGEYRENGSKALATTFLLVPTGVDSWGAQAGYGYQVQLVGGESRKLAEQQDEDTSHRWYIYVSSSEFQTSYYAMLSRASLDAMGLLTEVKGVGPTKAAHLLDTVLVEQVLLYAADGDAKGLAKLAKGTGFGPSACNALCSGELHDAAAELYRLHWPDEPDGSCASATLRAAQELYDEVERWLRSLGVTVLEYQKHLDKVVWVDYVDDGKTQSDALQSIVRDVLAATRGTS